MKKMVIPKKTDKQIEEEIEGVLNGKDKSYRGIMLRNAAKALSVHKSKEEIKKMFIEEYKKKYGLLQTGKISLDELKEGAVKDAKKAQKVL